MSQEEIKRIWVFIEHNEGTIHTVSWELMGAANKLSKDLENSVVEAVLLGQNMAHVADEVLYYGAQRVYVMDSPVLRHYRNQPYCEGVSKLVSKYMPEIFLIGATTSGRDLGGSIAARNSTGLTADCTELSIDPKLKILSSTRPTFGGNLMATILCKTHRPQMATIRPRVLPMMDALPHKTDGDIIYEALEMTEEQVDVKLSRFIPSEAQLQIEYADIIVAGGRGAGGPEGMKLLEELADSLNGIVAATRPVVDAGLVDYSRQVGQTGKTVRPKLYIAAGISGAVQHSVGMNGSDFILAINTDPEAAIFQIADAGIVGDIHEVVPELIRQIKENSGGLKGVLNG